MDETMGSNDNTVQKQRNFGSSNLKPKSGGWADYVEARLDMRERTERLRTLRLRKRASTRQGHDQSGKANKGRR